MSEKITILHIDDHPVFRYGIETVIKEQPDMVLVAQASTGQQGIDYFRWQKADIILMDLRLPDMSGIDAMMAIRAEFPDARCIILTTFELENEIRRALAEGAQAYMLKSMPPRELLDAIREVHAGKRKVPIQIATTLAEHYSDEPLSDREVEVLRYLVDGNRNRDIAEKLYIGEETVKAHMKHIMEKLGANDRTQALAIALRRGLIHL
ncbi:MAG TPA: response regulator transcription factor [Terriglobales bacterium]|jgi:DNA-binding NarL/FixJ family response regulator|nr:response regulator transcription factor [Terriglobales bacterium]